jgi:hypothetical protein
MRGKLPADSVENARFIEVMVLDASAEPAINEVEDRLGKHRWTFQLESTEGDHERWRLTRPDDFSAQGFRHAFENHVPVRVPEAELQHDAEAISVPN